MITRAPSYRGVSDNRAYLRLTISKKNVLAGHSMNHGVEACRTLQGKLESINDQMNMLFINWWKPNES